MAWEITDPKVKAKIRSFASKPQLVEWSGSAERDMGSLKGITAQAVLDGLIEHLDCGFRVEADHMKNGDLAYIFHSFVGPGRLYVKVKFVFEGEDERMRVFSAHTNR